MEIVRPWCLLMDTGRTLTAFIEGGEIRSASAGEHARFLLEYCKDFACFTNAPKAIMALSDARYFQGKQRRERLLDIRYDEGTRIVCLPPVSIPGDSYAYAMAFATYCEWLQNLGIEFTKRRGWNTLGRMIWKVTDGEHKFDGPKTGRLSFYGGRKQAPYPITFRNTQSLDISGAYLHSLGNNVIPGRVRSAPLGEWRTKELDGLAYAKVNVPSDLGEWNPLPVRADKRSIRMLRFPSGDIEGFWPYSELRMAESYGCQVEVLESWAGQHTKPYFEKWYRTMLEGRALPDGGAIFAKQHANLLWSSFATSPTRIIWKRWKDEYGRQPIIIKEQQAGRDFTAYSAYISAIVSARIRERIYTEVLCPGGEANLFVVYVDTDGFLTGTKNNLPRSVNVQLRDDSEGGRWRQKGFYPLVEIKSSNAYRYTCLECGREHEEWHYVCAGATNPDTARRFFRNQPRTSEPIDLDSIDPEQLPEFLSEYKPSRKRVRKTKSGGIVGASVPSYRG